MKTRKAAASIYIVIFTTTLLGIITLSFVRIMLSESLRTLNYSLSQSAYNSSLAGVEDAKIVLLRYQNCLNNIGYLSNCQEYLDAFQTESAAENTAQDCDIIRKLLHYNDNGNETLVQTNSSTSTTKSAQNFDQAYTCVKINTITDDYVATLNDNNPTKIIPLRSVSQATQNSINRISLQWFSVNDFHAIAPNNELGSNWYHFKMKNTDPEVLTGALMTNKTAYEKENGTYKNSFVNTSASGYGGIVPPVLQSTLIQSAPTFRLDDFYVSDSASGATNRGTLLLRPSSNATLMSARGLSDGGNNSNRLHANALADSSNKHFNTPIDVYCKLNEEDWAGGYACMADFVVPNPIGSTERNYSTSFLVLNLPYASPSTDVKVQMYHCEDSSKGLYETVTVGSETKTNCSGVRFSNVQPSVDSTGRANDLFRRIEARVELVDTYFPIANYALAMTDPNNTKGIQKDFYVTSGCTYSTSYWDTQNQVIKYESGSCPDSSGDSGE